MKRLVIRLAALLLLSAAGWSVPPSTIRAQEQPNPVLPKVALQAGIHLIQAEVAADFGTRARGLMFRESLGPNQGMIFVFEEPQRQCFWMRNTKIPLSTAFIDDLGKIVNIAEMQPMTENSHCSNRPVRFVLEMEQGWFAKKGLAPGSRLTGPKGFFKTE